MAGFEFNIDNELNNIRKKPGTGASKPADVKPEEAKPAPQAVASEAPVAPEPREITTPEPEGFGIDQSHQESNNGASSTVRRRSNPVNWKGFKTLNGVFELVGGDRPVLLKEPIARSQVSGLPEPLILVLQDQLREKYKGETVDFPWGTFTIGDRNGVFTTKLSLFRYLLFDGLRDGNGIEVQYAKQWLISHHPAALDINFNPKILKQSSDELDIYALLIVSAGTEVAAADRSSESDFQASDQLALMNANVSLLMDMVNNQATTLESFAERNHTLQTVTLLDRMGLLKGGLPKDTGEFIRVLEQNRSAIETMSESVDDHITAEKDRKRVLEREARMKAAYATRR